MITNSFDNSSEAIINPRKTGNALKVDVCIITFSHIIEKYVTLKYSNKVIATLKTATGETPIYLIEQDGKRIALYKTFVGAPITVGLAEEAMAELDCTKFVLFGGAGCLNKQIAHGKVMIPTAAYRDEGTSYHYEKASDYTIVDNYKVVARFMEEKHIPYVLGKTWTTDSFYRETRNNFEKRKKDGCISVEMECSGLQAMCHFRNLELYAFFTSGDLLDAPEWDSRRTEDDNTGTQHDTMHFDIALELANYVAKM